MKVPSTENPVKLVWVNACTNEVQSCRQLAAINIVVLKENPDTEASARPGQLVAGNVTLEAKGDLEQEPQPLQRRIWSIVPWSRKVPLDVDTCFSKKTAFLIQENAKMMEHYHAKKHEMHQNWKPEPSERTGTVSDPW